MEEKALLDFFRAFANADRLRIAGQLGLKPLSANELAGRLGIRPMQALNHLEKLTATGLVKADGNRYRLDVAELEALSRRVLSGLRPQVSPNDFDGEAYDRKVLSDFIRADGRLKGIPSQYKKLQVILRHLAKAFEPGVKYPEKQVNQILQRFHEDPASLRRYLVDFKFLERQRGIYWLVEAEQ